MYRILCLSLFMMLSGCAGVGVLYPHDWAEVESPMIGSTRGHFFRNTDKSIQFTCSQVVDLWGEPDDVIEEDGLKQLVYTHGLVFAGVMPFIVIPIPLALPVGSEKDVVECANGVVKRAYKVGTELSAAYCGMTSEKPSFGCEIE